MSVQNNSPTFHAFTIARGNSMGGINITVYNIHVTKNKLLTIIKRDRMETLLRFFKSR